MVTFKCVELLVKAGANVNTVNPMGVSVLQQVVWQPHSSCKDVMEKMGAKYIPEDHSHQKCMEILLRAGVGTKTHRQNVIDAFMSAIEYNYHGCMKVLIRAGADVNRVYPDGFTPLGKAAFLCDFTAVEILLRAGARVNGDDRSAKTPLMNAVSLDHKKCLQMATKRQTVITEENHSHEKCVNLLVNAGADVKQV